MHIVHYNIIIRTNKYRFCQIIFNLAWRIDNYPSAFYNKIKRVQNSRNLPLALFNDSLNQGVSAKYPSILARLLHIHILPGISSVFLWMLHPTVAAPLRHLTGFHKIFCLNCQFYYIMRFHRLQQTPVSLIFCIFHCQPSFFLIV